MKKTTKVALVVTIGAGVFAWNTLGVNYMVNKEIDPVNVYFSAEEIPPGLKITEDMMNYKTMPATAIPPNAITDPDDILGKYVKHGYGMPKNSYFFDDTVLAENDMPNSSVLKLKDGEVAFPLIVDLETSLGNGIVPDTKVNLAFRAKIFNEETGKEQPIFGELAENVRVTSVKDNNALAVFSDDGTGKKNTESQALSKLYTFAVDDELNSLLLKAVMLGEVRPIAKGEVSDSQETVMSTDEIISWIESNSYKINDPKKDQLADGNKE